MSRYPTPADDDHQPVMWLQGHAIYAAHFLVVVYVVSMLATTLLMFFNVDGLAFQWLSFSSEAVFHGQVWRILTYGFVNPPSLGFAIDMLMIVWFGRELEKFFGRRTFFLLYGCIYLLSPAMLCLVGLWQPMSLSGATGSFALFIAFATLYPGAVLLFELVAKWVAIVLVAIYTLMDLAYHNLTGLITLWTTVGFAFAFVRYHQGELSLPRFRLPRRKPKLRVLPDLEDVSAEKSTRQNSMAEVDALLDKIARSGISSLTAKELARLDQARAALRKKDSVR